MADCVVDSSVTLAVIRGEAGATAAAPRLAQAVMSAANYAEVISKIIDLGATTTDAVAATQSLGMEVAPLDASMAAEAASLRAQTRSRGLSLGDRACLALGQRLGLPVYTADRAWAELDLGVEVVLIR
jgi:ribonuclease VapC